MKKKKVKIKLTIKDKNRLPSEFISDADDKSKKSKSKKSEALPSDFIKG